MTRLGESCSHVAAVLFKLEAAVRLGYTNKACTDVACSWNASFVGKVQPAPIANIELSRKQRSESAETSSVQPTTSAATGDDVTADQEEFLQQLASISKPVCLSLFDSTCDAFQPSLPQLQPQSSPSLPQSLRSLYQPLLCNASDAVISEHCQSLDISLLQSEIDSVEKASVLQSKSVTWYEQRTGRITASVAHKVLRTNPANPSKSLILSITSGAGKDLNVPSIVYGRENEPVAIGLFKEQLPDLHNDADINSTGLRISGENPWLGASPDGIMSCSCHGNSVVEVKCPYSMRGMSVSEILQHPNCCLTAEGLLNKQHPYYTQLQIQMFVFNVTYGVLLLYTGSLVILNVERDDAFLQSCIPQLGSFWQRHILRELVTRKLELYGDNPPSSVPLVCYCQQPKEHKKEQLIKCSGSSCPFGGLIHLGCIKPKRKYPPKKSWWCRVCRKQKN